MSQYRKARVRKGLEYMGADVTTVQGTRRAAGELGDVRLEQGPA